LLSALTRLEDRMVPSQADGSRFSTSVSGVERFGGDQGSKRSEGGDDSDTGVENRLRIPSKKKKEEAEREPEPDLLHHRASAIFGEESAKRLRAVLLSIKCNRLCSPGAGPGSGYSARYHA